MEETVRRKISYRMYPNATQREELERLLGLHCRVYNTLLEEHQKRHAAGDSFFSYNQMSKELTGWRSEVPSLAEVNAQSLQVTAKRLDLAFQSFFRRVKAGEEPGYPRFKSFKRYPGWGYKTHGDGWRFFEGEKRGHILRLSGVGMIKVRGKGRFSGAPKTAEILHKSGKWYLSVTFTVEASELSRVPGTRTGAFDWGLEKLLTIARDDGSIQIVDNPRWLKRCLEQIKILQRTISVEMERIKVSLGIPVDEAIPKGTRFPVTVKLKRLQTQVRNIHGKIARQRHDFYHKLSAWLVSEFIGLATEEISPKVMSKRPKKKPSTDGSFEKNGAARKAGLNRSVLDAAPGMLLRMIHTKAEEAGCWFELAPTRKLKPSQRCWKCGGVVKKTLADRVHICSCGCTCDRDENSARTTLRWLLEGDYWSGTGQMVASSH